MQLKYNQTIRKNIVIINLEAVNFTPREIEAFKRFGEPSIVIDKMYPLESDSPSFPVNINRKIRSSLKLRVKFDGTEDITAALEAAESFFDDIRNTLSDILYEITDKLDDTVSYDIGTGIEIIRSGEEGFVRPPRPCPPSPPKPNYSGGTVATNPSYHVRPPMPSSKPCDCDDMTVVWTDDDSIYNP